MGLFETLFPNTAEYLGLKERKPENDVKPKTKEELEIELLELKIRNAELEQAHKNMVKAPKILD